LNISARERGVTVATVHLTELKVRGLPIFGQ
jgi:hypothetical protein